MQAKEDKEKFSQALNYFKKSGDNIDSWQGNPHRESDKNHFLYYCENDFEQGKDILDSINMQNNDLDIVVLKAKKNLEIMKRSEQYCEQVYYSKFFQKNLGKAINLINEFVNRS